MTVAVEDFRDLLELLEAIPLLLRLRFTGSSLDERDVLCAIAETGLAKLALCAVSLALRSL